MSNRRRPVYTMLVLLGTLGAPELVAQGYGGPSILSRGGNAPGRRGRAPVDFNVHASVRGVYDTGLLRPVLNEEGELEGRSVYGLQVEGGIYGGRDWRRHSLGVDYRADYRHQPSLRGISGTNQALSLSTQHRISRRMLLVLQQTGGTSNRAFGAFAAPTFGGLGTLGVPLTEFFDVRIYYAQTAAVLSYQKSARTTLSVGGDAFFVKRKSLSLINGQGARAHASASYRFSRRTAVSGSFLFMRFEYPRVYSHSDIYGVNVGVQRALTRNLELDVAAGLYQVTSAGVQRVTLSPEVAAILGRPTGSVAFVRRERPPMVQATLSYLQERGRAYVRASSGVMPGNGIFLTTNRTTVNGGYSYTGVRRLSMGVSGGWTRVGSIVLDLPNFTIWQAGAGMSYQLRRHVNLSAQFDRRHFSGASTTRGRSGSSIALGLTYTPSRFPISIW